MYVIWHAYVSELYVYVRSNFDFHILLSRGSVEVIYLIALVCYLMNCLRWL